MLILSIRSRHFIYPLCSYILSYADLMSFLRAAHFSNVVVCSSLLMVNSATIFSWLINGFINLSEGNKWVQYHIIIVIYIIIFTLGLNNDVGCQLFDLATWIWKLEFLKSSIQYRISTGSSNKYLVGASKISS